VAAARHGGGLVPLVVWFAISLLRFAPESQAAVRAWVASPVTMIMLILVIAVGFWHAALGLQVVIEDYVHAKGWRIGLDMAVKFAAAALTLAGIVAIFRIAFGG
jgi:succinate dehydrogenase / fumarate reductase membrane anchor subunit